MVVPLSIDWFRSRSQPDDQSERFLSFRVFARKARPKSPGAFSLVEVVIALGVVSFALVSLIGLLPVSLRSAQSAMETARVAKVIQEVSNDLIQSGYSAVKALPAETRLFDYEGFEVSPPEDGYYEVRIEPDGDLALPGDAGSAEGIAMVHLDVRTRGNGSRMRTAITVPDLGE